MVDRSFEPELQEYLSSGQALSVLVVDDSKAVRAAIRDRLELGNLQVIEAHDGPSALKLTLEKVPDLVLLDVVLAGVDGISVLRTLRDTHTKQQLPIIAILSGDSPTEIVQALDAGANDYVTKPVDYDVLWARLSNQLMQKQAAEYLRHAQNSLEHQIRQRTKELNSSNQKLKRVIQERLLAEDRLQRQANYDALTGLPNRSLAKDRLQQTIAKAKRQDLCPGVAFVDLDNFKYVNDTLGHAAGDQLLIEAARRLSACARKSDTVARLGGDEFVLILEDTDKQACESRELDLRHVGERIIRSFAEPFVLDGTEVSVTPSLGFAIYPRDGDDGDALMRRADAAMYRSKKDGKNTYCFYSSEMTVKAKMRVFVETQLRQALEKGELSLNYEPIVDVHSGKIVKAEAQLRWDSRKLGVMAPEYFIKVAEHTGLIVPIGQWAIQSACEQVHSWRDSGIDNISVTVNVPARQFQAGGKIVEAVDKALSSNGLPAAALQLELPEAVLVNASPATRKILEELGEMGIKLLIDQFGTGYTSLACLQRYHPAAVKVDPHSIANVLHSRRDAQLVRAILAMAGSLDVPVVAEGVETKAQLEFLRDSGCRYAQGSYISKALPAEQFFDLLRKHKGCDSRKKTLQLAT